jgi:hypothetical protein
MKLGMPLLRLRLWRLHPRLDFRRYLIVMFFLTHRLFCKFLACNLLRYCICSPYCCYTCHLNILGTRIEASVSSSRNQGMTVFEVVYMTIGHQLSMREC